jgi:ADP-heptose:LPS heptosyltransferase
MTQPGSDLEPRRIELYRPQNQLGDLLLNVPAIRALRDRYPSSHITLVVGPQNAPAVLGQAWVDRVRVVPTRGVGALVGGIHPERATRGSRDLFHHRVVLEERRLALALVGRHTAPWLRCRPLR